MTELDTISLKPLAAPRCWALIPCAGTGSRAGAAGPKQYQVLAGQPMVMHTLGAFAEVSRIDQTLVVVSPDDCFFQTPQAINASFLIASCGGSTRAASVFNGLNALLAEGAVAHDWVLVHDAARCLIRPDLIDRLIDACLGDEVGGLLALPLADTLKQAHSGRVDTTLVRHDKWLAQTPQMFRIGSLLEALELAGDAVTDESSAIESMGLSPKLVPGSTQNFKVTYPEDFALAQALLESRDQGGSSKKL
jgi:2-C-methyl-D-erythritol 4-phosphate cytidylyltransferase